MKFEPCVQENSSENVCCGVPLSGSRYQQVLYRIVALKSLFENFQEDLSMHFIKTPP